jgi:hypothetical protein
MKKGVWLVCLMVTGACSSGDGERSTRADTLTQRQRDSIVAASKLPGAGAVGAALRASDSLAARARAQDSIRR